MKVKLSCLVCLLAALFMVVGCAPTKAPAPKAEVPAGYRSIRMVGGTLGGQGTTASMALAAIFNKYCPEIEWSSCSGSASATAVYLTKGEVKLAMQTPVAYVDAYGSEKVLESRLRSITVPLPMVHFLFVIPEDQPWKDITEVPKGANLCPGGPGTSGPPTTEAWLKLVGLSKTDFKWAPLGKAELADAWRSGKVDVAMLSVSGVPSSLVDMYTSPRKLKAMGLTPEQAAKAKAEQAFERIGYPGVGKSSLMTEASADIFKYEVVCPQQPYPLACRDDFPEELAYKMAKVLDEHRDESAQIFAAMKHGTPQRHIQWAKPPLDIHSGAAKYYKEKGYLK